MQNFVVHRNLFWDLVKGILIILVVAGHVIQYSFDRNGNFFDNSVFKAIYSFHMPLFMMLSGYFSLNGIQKDTSWLLSRARQLMLPSIVLAIAVSLLLITKAFYRADDNLMQETINNCYTPLFWYLCVLFECSVFGWMMFRLKAWWWRIVWLILPLIFFASLPYLAIWTDSEIPYKLWPYYWFFPDMWIYFLIGLTVKAIRKDNFLPSHLWAIFLPLAALCYVFFETANYIYITPLTASTATWEPSFYRILTGIICSLAFLYILKLLQPVLAKQRWLLNLGCATMAIYILQDVFWAIGGYCVTLKIMSFAKHHETMEVLIALFHIAWITAGCYFTYHLLRRNRWCALLFFGEKLPNASSKQTSTQASSKLD